MKQAIHPPYYDDAQVSCACGNTFTTGSTKQKLTLDICAACHPFFTGEMKYVDTAGRVDRFKDKMAAMNQSSFMKKKEKKAAKKEAQRKALMEAPQTMKEMMEKVKKETAVKDPASSKTTQGHSNPAKKSAKPQDDQKKDDSDASNVMQGQTDDDKPANDTSASDTTTEQADEEKDKDS